MTTDTLSEIQAIETAWQKGHCQRCGLPTKRKTFCSTACWSAAQNAKHKLNAKPVMERLWAKVDTRGPDECWLWTGGVTDVGYGLLVVGSRTDKSRKYLYAHRLAFEEANKCCLLPGIEACHTCDTPRCCNPRHLFAGTTKENAEDCSRKGRHCQGSRHPFVKLTVEQVLYLREHAYKRRGNLTRLAAQFGVSIATAHEAIHGGTWKRLS